MCWLCEISVDWMNLVKPEISGKKINASVMVLLRKPLLNQIRMNWHIVIGIGHPVGMGNCCTNKYRFHTCWQRRSQSTDEMNTMDGLWIRLRRMGYLCRCESKGKKRKTTLPWSRVVFCMVKMIIRMAFFGRGYHRGRCLLHRLLDLNLHCIHRLMRRKLHCSGKLRLAGESVGWRLGLHLCLCTSTLAKVVGYQ